jgi:hypothetical protein
MIRISTRRFANPHISRPGEVVVEIMASLMNNGNTPARVTGVRLDLLRPTDWAFWIPWFENPKPVPTIDNRGRLLYQPLSPRQRPEISSRATATVEELASFVLSDRDWVEYDLERSFAADQLRDDGYRQLALKGTVECSDVFGDSHSITWCWRSGRYYPFVVGCDEILPIPTPSWWR